MNHHKPTLAVILILALTVPMVLGVFMPSGTVFISEVGGGSISFSQNVNFDMLTWANNRTMFYNISFNGNTEWSVIGFRAPIGATSLQITQLNQTNVVMETGAGVVQYEVYLGAITPPTVTGADSSNFAAGVLYFNTTGAETVILDWTPPQPSVTRMIAEVYDEGNYTAQVRDLKTSALSVNASISSTGQSFKSNVTARITSTKFYLSKINFPTASITAELWTHNGTLGVTGNPLVKLATSDPVNSSTLTGVKTLYSFNFTGAEQYLLESEVDYCIVLNVTKPGVIGFANYIRVATDLNASTHEGLNMFYGDSAWSVDVGEDAIFYIYVEGVAPVNTALNDDTPYIRDSWQWMNVTIEDNNGWRDLSTVTIQVNTTSDINNYTMRWTQSGNAFTEVSDPDSIITLNTTTSLRTIINSTKLELSFNVTFTAGQSGLCDARITTVDDEGLRDTDLYSNAFQFTFFN